MGEYWGRQISYLDGAISARLTSSRGASSMLLFFFPVHAETCDNAVVATASVIATWKHVGVVVDVTAVAAVLERGIICNQLIMHLHKHRKGRETKQSRAGLSLRRYVLVTKYFGTAIPLGFDPPGDVFIHCRTNT